MVGRGQERERGGGMEEGIGGVNPGIPGATGTNRQECWLPSLTAPHHLLQKATCAECINHSATGT